MLPVAFPRHMPHPFRPADRSGTVGTFALGKWMNRGRVLGNHFGDAVRRVLVWGFEQAVLLLVLIYGIVMLAIAPLWAGASKRESAGASHHPLARSRHA